MQTRKQIDCYFFQYLRALRHELRRARFAHRISDISYSPGFGEARAGAPRPLTVFTAADSIYFTKYARAFAGSLVKHVAAPRMHAHLYNPDAPALAALAAIGSAYPELALSWTTETFSEAALDKAAKAAAQSWTSLYICCTRFLAAQTVQARLNAPLLILDIDILFNADIRPRFAGDIEYAAMLRLDQCNLAKRTLGGTVFASLSPRGRLFLEQICVHVERFIAGKTYWAGFDQYALYRAYRHMKSRMGLAGFSELTAKDVSLNLGPDALILYPKGKIKDEEEFAQLARQFDA